MNDLVNRLQDRVAELEAALRPFAEVRLDHVTVAVLGLGFCSRVRQARVALDMADVAPGART
jgi:hypothetical protein